MDSLRNVIPAKAGIQEAKLQATAEFSWMPAYALIFTHFFRE